MRDERKRIAATLSALAENYGREISAGGMVMMIQAVEDLGADRIGAACARAVRERKWMPNAAELRELAGAGASPAASDDAWGQVLDCLAGHSAWADLPPLVRRALTVAGGSSSVRNADERMLPQVRGRFLDAFKRAEREEAERPALPAQSGTMRDARGVVVGLVTVKSIGGAR